MFLTLLGTGCPSVNQYRYGPSNLIHNNNTKILIDCGSGVTQRLLDAGYDGSQIDYLLLTHLHSDHVVDFYQLIISSWHQYRKKEWKIIGPIGTESFLSSCMEIWKEERQLRINFEKRDSIKAFDLHIKEINDDNSFMVNDIKVEYFKVDLTPCRFPYH